MGDGEAGPQLGDGSDRLVWSHWLLSHVSAASTKRRAVVGQEGAMLEHVGERREQGVIAAAWQERQRHPQRRVPRSRPAATASSCVGIQLCRDTAVWTIRRSGVQLRRILPVHGSSCLVVFKHQRCSVSSCVGIQLYSVSS